MKKHSTTEERKKVIEQSSQFVEDFSGECRDKGITESGLGIQLFPRSKKYEENYDKINWNI